MHMPADSKKFDTFLEQTLNRDGFPALLQFPKEFRRSWIRQVDTRFVAILVATFLIEVGLVLFFLSWVVGKETNLDIYSIQKRYANLLLNKSGESDFFNSDSKSRATYLYGVPEESEDREPGLDNQARSNNDLTGRTTINRTESWTGVQSASNDVTAGSSRLGQQGTDFNSSERTERIGHMGILAYLSDDNNGSKEEINGLLGSGEDTRYLEGSLANLKITSFAPGGKNASTGAGSSRTSLVGIKAAKSVVSQQELQASLAPLEQVSYRAVAKNTELEESSQSLLAKTGNKASARKAEHITQVVLEHNRAIQDCYKQALKKQPDLKGKVVVRFSVTPEGKVDLVEAISSTFEEESIIKCILNRIRRWNDFGESDVSLGTVSYRQTYVFGY